MKKMISLLLALIMCCSFTATIFASNELSTDRLQNIGKNVEAFLANVNVRKEIKSSTYLYNYSDEIEALFYQLSGGGYVVASYKDGHIIEYSPDNLPTLPNNASKRQKIFYGGPMLFCAETNDGLKNIVTGELIDKDTNSYSIEYKDVIPSLSFDTISPTNQTRETPLLSTPVNYVSATTSNGWFCTITGIVNLLQYYHDFFSADVYSGNVSTIYGMRTALNSNGYIYNGYLYLSDAATTHTEGGTTYYGLRSYLSRNDVTNYYVTDTTITCAKVKSQIGTYSRPVLLMINTSSISNNSGTHIVLCYGYWETSMTTYYIVNNGWGSNSVYVCADDVPTNYEMLYLHQ